MFIFFQHICALLARFSRIGYAQPYLTRWIGASARPGCRSIQPQTRAPVPGRCCRPASQSTGCRPLSGPTASCPLCRRRSSSTHPHPAAQHPRQTVLNHLPGWVAQRRHHRVVGMVINGWRVQNRSITTNQHFKINLHHANFRQPVQLIGFLLPHLDGLCRSAGQGNTPSPGGGRLPRI